MAEPASVTLTRVQARQPGGPSLHGVSLALRPGEIVTLLGAPGAGKTTVLQVMAGFVRPGAGQVQVAGRDVVELSAGRRGVGLVEQSLGLFERMTVSQTLRFVATAAGRIPALLEAAGLTAVRQFYPASLDPGQRARLAVARALAATPRALLLDDVGRGLEPQECQALFALVHAARASGIGVVYATRDPQHAMALGDRMLVIADGAIRQEGTSQAIYDEPADAAVAALTGSGNFLPGSVHEETDEGVTVRLDAGPTVEARSVGVAPGARCVVFIRPERIAISSVSPEELGEGAFAGLVETVMFHGDHIKLGLRVGDVSLAVLRPAAAPLRGIAEGRSVSLAWAPHHATAFRTSMNYR